MRSLLRILLGCCLVLVIGAGVLLWRLDQGPVSLTFAQPLLQSLADRGSPYLVTFSDPTLVWLRQQDVLALEVRNAEARTANGALVASAPLVRGTVAVTPLLLEQRLELVDIELDLPEIQLKRDANRKLILTFAGKLAEIPLGEAAGGGGLGTLLGESGEINDPRLGSIQLVRVTAPSLLFVDEVTGDRATAANAVFELEQSKAVWGASLKGDLGGGTIEAIGAPTTTPARPDITLELRGLRPKDFQAFAPGIPLAGLNVPASGSLKFSLDVATGERGPATIDLALGAGEIAVTTLGLPPVPIKEGLLRSTMEAGWAMANIDRLELVADGFALGVGGRAGVVDGKAVADLKLEAKELDVAEVLQVWPTEIAGAARAWIAANLPAGQLSTIAFQIDERGARSDQPDLGGSFTFAGAEVRYLDTMPPASGVAGSASLAGNSLQVKLTSGRAGEVDLTRGMVTLTNLTGAATTQLKVNADLRSTVPAAMRLLDAEPVALRRNTGLTADRASGNQTTNLDLSLPLLDEIPPARIRYKATTRLTDVEIAEVSPGYSLAANGVALVAEPAGISVTGEARINGVPLTVDLRENTPPAKGVNRTVKIAGRVDAAAAKALRFEWPQDVGGAVGVNATIAEAKSPLRTVDLALDLRAASIEIPELVIAKRAGEAGSVSARLVQANERSLAIERGRVEFAGWQAEGDASLGLDPVRLERIALRQLRAPLGELTADLNLDGARWRGRVEIGRLDLRPVLQRASGPSSGEAQPIPDFLVQITARQLRLGDAPFSNLAGTVERRGGMWQTAKLTANIEDSRVSLDLDTPTKRSAAILRGSDAGWLIRGLTSSDNGIRGGTFRLSADLSQTGGALAGDGDLRIRDFTLWGAPTIARIVSLASFSGLSNALSGRGVPVTRLVVPFRLRDRVLTLEQARLVGSDIGARADGTINLAQGQLNITGTVAPAYTVNRIIGRIPILGQILSGSRSDAALAATFSVTGALGQPQVSVNPLAALVPGMIRDLFSAFTADTEQSSRIDER